jgi:hypothetical protein
VHLLDLIYFGEVGDIGLDKSRGHAWTSMRGDVGGSAMGFGEVEGLGEVSHDVFVLWRVGVDIGEVGDLQAFHV